MKFFFGVGKLFKSEKPSTFDIAFDRVLGHEGGLIDDKSDPGGLTNWGISQRSYPGIDIRSLTRERAKEIYRTDFWDKLQADKLHPAVAFQLFDGAVNHGIKQSVKLLQRAVHVTQDGIMGPKTIAAVRAVKPNELAVTLGVERLLFCTDLTTWSRYGKGWVRRVAQNLIYSLKDS